MNFLDAFLDRHMHYRDMVISDDVRVYSIGDVHGCQQEFKKLIEEIHLDAKNHGKRPLIIQHGDIIDRGPSFFEVIDQTYISCMSLIGNHEYKFILERMGRECDSTSRRISHEKYEALDKFLQKKVMKFFNEMYNFISMNINGRQFILSHAPVRNMESFQGINEYRGNTNAAYFCMRSTVPDDAAMSQLDKEVTFVYGHQSWEHSDIEGQKQKQAGRKAQYFNIDGSCCYGGKLIALCLNDLSVIQVTSNVNAEGDLNNKVA